MLSEKIGKKILETTFYRLKKEAKTKRGESEEWLDNYAKYQFIEFYRKRIEELELVQRSLLKVLIEETEKEEKQQNKTIINQLSKTIADNSKVLGEFGMTPCIMQKLKMNANIIPEISFFINI
jgi:CDP-diacylglycerol pyrophosphatase